MTVDLIYLKRGEQITVNYYVNILWTTGSWLWTCTLSMCLGCDCSTLPPYLGQWHDKTCSNKILTY